MRPLPLFLAWLLLALPAAAQPVYRVAPGDRLSITVLEDPNLNAQVLVRPDGRITIPIAGSLLVSGRSPEEIQALLRERLAPGFNTPPTVNVALVAVAIPEAEIPEEEVIEPNSVYVLGEVGAPGRVDFTTMPPTVLQAIAQVGGLGRFANGSKIQVRRRDATTGQETIFLFDFREVEDGRPLSTNMTLMNGDVIYVPTRGLFD